MDSTKRICLWSGPRNISTALMYSFAQRSDTKIVDEPLYAHYLSKTNAHIYHPGANEILASMENDGNKVIANMLGPQDKPIVFFKQMTHHLVELDLNFLDQTINVILTRDPKDMLPSYDKAVNNPSMKDVGYEAHLKLYDHLVSINRTPLVLDSRRVLENPKEQLQLFCDKINVPFQENMLRWKAGPRSEDGCWAKYWYASVHQSTGFAAYKPKTESFPEHLKPLLKECEPIYKKLTALSF